MRMNCLKSLRILCFVSLSILIGEISSAQDTLRITRLEKSETLWFDRLCDASLWFPVEECRALPSKLACPDGGKSMELYFKVDYHGGEKAHPIGWPRAHINLLGREKNWRDWDHFEYMILVSLWETKK